MIALNRSVLLATAVTLSSISFFSPLACAEESHAETPQPQYLQIPIGKAKLGALLQTWLLADSSTLQAKNNFRLRRAEFKVTGSLTDRVRWFFMIDPAKNLSTTTAAGTTSGSRVTVLSNSDNKVLQDLGAGYALTDELELVVGQFKIQTVAESLDSSAELFFPERSLLGRTYGEKRQPGMLLAYKEKLWKASFMVSNGGSPNTDDTTTPKDMSLRLEGKPWDLGLGVGTFLQASDFRIDKNRSFGFNARWLGERETIRTEIVFAKNGLGTTDINSRAYVAEAGYSVLPQLQPVLRYETFQNDTSNDFKNRAVSLGLNSFLEKHNAKVQLAYVWLYNMTGSNGSYTATATGQPREHLVMSSFQIAI